MPVTKAKKPRQRSAPQNARAERRLQELQAEITKLEKERKAAVRRVQRSFLGGLRSAMAT